MWLLVLTIYASADVHRGRDVDVESIQINNISSYEECVKRAEGIMARNQSYSVGQDHVHVTVRYNCFENKEAKENQ